MQVKKEEAKKVVDKLKFDPPRKTHHDIYWFCYEGKKILKTRISKGRGEFRATDRFRSQLMMNEQQLRDTISFEFNYGDYVELLYRKGLIPEL
jgi:hypothetical protein